MLLFLLFPLIAALLFLACNRAIDEFYRETTPEERGNPRRCFWHVFKAMTSITAILFTALCLPSGFADFSLSGLAGLLFQAAVFGGMFGAAIGFFVGVAAAIGARRSPRLCKAYAFGTMVLGALAVFVV
jgi:hypothetical protein